MFKNLTKEKRQKGFTIIEVLIVLAIAGLIMVIVLVAVPQLQRNQRNEGRRADAARVGTAASNWMANNSGAVIPTAGVPQTNALNAIRNDVGNLGQYQTANIGSVGGTSGGTSVTNLNDIRIVTGAICTGSGIAGTTGAGTPPVVATSRQLAIIYATETNGGGAQPQCIGI